MNHHSALSILGVIVLFILHFELGPEHNFKTTSDIINILCR